VYVASEAEIDGVFDSLARKKVGGLVAWQEAYFRSRRDQIVSLARHYGIPAIYGRRLFADVGGLMSYVSYGPRKPAAILMEDEHAGQPINFLDEIDMDQCTNGRLEPETCGSVEPQKSLWSEDHAHL
jgi:hypothetical protein